jgi:release factor glutamine methyltransferase
MTPSVPALLRDAAATLQAAGIESAQREVRLLLAHCLGVPASRLVTTDRIDLDAAARFDGLLTRRAAHEPLQYLLGSAPFRYLSVDVGPGVFIPRPETELLVDAVLPGLRALDRPLVVDLCAGSGALALAIADELPGARVIAVECAPAALQWLRRNCAGSPVTVIEADVREIGSLADYQGSAAAVLCNPPYVPRGTAVSAEVAHDPPDAVFAGADGLALMPAVIDAAAALLSEGGVLALEHDDSHGDSVPSLLRERGGWRAIIEHRDLTGRDRYATAVRAARS